MDKIWICRFRNTYCKKEDYPHNCPIGLEHGKNDSPEDCPARQEYKPEEEDND